MGSNWQHVKTLGKLPQNKITRRQVFVTIAEIEGKYFLNIRTYFKGEKGKWMPTCRGVTTDVNNTDMLIEIMEKAKAYKNDTEYLQSKAFKALKD